MAGSLLQHWTIFTAVALLQICVAVELPEDPSAQIGAGFRAVYNETAGSFRIFPDSNVQSELDYQYFSERIDFETFEDSILIGAADKLYKLDFELSSEGELSWTTDDTNRQTCEQEYSDKSQVVRNYFCRNHIRLYHRVPFEDDLLYVCGTQSIALPQCRSVNIANGVLGEAGVSADASSGLISAHPDYPNHGTFRNLTSTDNNFISWSHETTSTFPFSFTEQDVTASNSMTSNSEAFGTVSSWFDAPTYIVDMIYLSFDQTGFQFQNPAYNYDFYFVFLRERYQLELEGRLDTEPLILSRVVRICKDDPGVILDDSPIFSTLLKTRIYCDQESPGSNDNPLGAVNNRYNDIWSIALNGESGGRSYPSQNSYSIRKLYGAFSTPLTGPAGSAICIYAASASTNNRNQNRGLFDTFIDDITLAANPDRTVENRYSHCDGNGRPVTDGTTLGAADTVVSRTMIQLGVNPLIVFDSIYITQMVVDELCVVENNRSQCINQDVLFLGTSLGTIRKVVLIGETSPVVAEEIVLENDNFINDLKIKEVNGVKHLFASTSSHVYRLSLERCGRHSTYTACVESRDPYCVWNANAYGCQRNTLTANGELANTEVPDNLFQNVHTGFIDGTTEVSLEMESYSFEEDEVVINVVSNTTVSDGWVELAVLGDDTSSGPYPVAFSGGLTAMVTVPFSDLSSADLTSSTVVMVFTIQLNNTDIGRVYFPRREASLRTVVKATNVYFGMESYTSDEGDEISINVISNKTISDDWVELVLTGFDSTLGTYPVVFSGGLTATVTILFSALPIDGIFVGSRDFTLQLRNTDMGSALFSRQEAPLTIEARATEVSLGMESYSFQEGEDIVIDVSSNKTIYDYWVELVIVKDGDIALGPYPVVFSGELSATVTIPFSSIFAIYADGSTFTIRLRNIANRGAFFSRQEASLRIVIDGAITVSLSMEFYSFEEGDDVTIDVSSSVIISDGVELVLTRNGDITSGPYPVVFSEDLTATVTIPFSSISDDDTVFTGVNNFTIRLRSTNMDVFFAIQEATLSIVDNDGALVEIGLVGSECSQFPEQTSSDFTELNTMIKNGIENVEGLGVELSNCELHCRDDLPLVAVSYRCTMTSDQPNVGTTRLHMALRQWAMEEQTIKLGNGIEVMVSSSCTYIILSSDYPLCQSFVSTGELTPASPAFSLSAPASIVSLALAGLLVAAVLMCVLLGVALVVVTRRIKKNQCVTPSKQQYICSATSDETIVEHKKKSDNGYNQAFSLDTKDLSREPGDSLSSRSSDSNPPLHSAAPLVNGKNPFVFPPQKIKKSDLPVGSSPHMRVGSNISIISNEHAL